MCNHLIVLSRRGPLRYVASCEHGVTHLIWDNLSLRMPTADFVQIVAAFSQAVVGAMQYRIAGTQLVCIVWDQHDRFSVWLAGAGLYLNAEEFRTLKELLDEAAAHPRLARQNPAPSQAPTPEPTVAWKRSEDRQGESDRKRAADELRVTPHLFSMN